MEDVATKDGYDIQMQTNHLSHFLLTKELYPLLKKAVEINGEARICNHSSEARRGKPLEKKYFEKRGGDLGGNGNSMFFNGARWVRYSQTKLANSVFSYSLAQKFEEENVQGMKAVCAHPGLASTQLQITTAQKDGMGWGMWIMRMSQSCEDGAMPIVASCFDKTTENGTFWGPKGVLTGKAVKIDFTRQDQRIKNLLRFFGKLQKKRLESLMYGSVSLWQRFHFVRGNNDLQVSK